MKPICAVLIIVGLALGLAGRVGAAEAISPSPDQGKAGTEALKWNESFSRMAGDLQTCVLTEARRLAPTAAPETVVAAAFGGCGRKRGVLDIQVWVGPLPPAISPSREEREALLTAQMWQIVASALEVISSQRKAHATQVQ